MKTESEHWDGLQRLIEIYSSLLSKAWEEALAEFNEAYGKTMYLYTKSDIASLIHAHLRGRIRVYFHNKPGIYIHDEPGKAFMLIIDGNVCGIPVVTWIKFKKCNRSLRTANIQTQAVKNFNTQNVAYNERPVIQDALFTDINAKVMNPPKVGCVISGYIPNATYSAYERLPVTFPTSKSKVKLLGDIKVESQTSATNITEFPKQPDIERPKRVRRRTQKQPKKQPRKFLKSEINETQPIKKKRVAGESHVQDSESSDDNIS